MTTSPLQHPLQYSLPVSLCLPLILWNGRSLRPVTVIGTGLLGWLLNIVMVLCSGPLYVSGYLLALRPQLMHAYRENLPGASGSAFLEIMALRIGKPGALFLWVRSSVLPLNNKTQASPRHLSASPRSSFAKLLFKLAPEQCMPSAETMVCPTAGTSATSRNIP